MYISTKRHTDSVTGQSDILSDSYFLICIVHVHVVSVKFSDDDFSSHHSQFVDIDAL